MPDADFDELLRRPAVMAAIGELGVSALSLEDVLASLHSFGSVRIIRDEHPDRPYVCLLEAGEERGRGRTVLHAAVACWAGALESLVDYTSQGVEQLERFLLGPDPA